MLDSSNIPIQYQFSDFKIGSVNSKHTFTRSNGYFVIKRGFNPDFKRLFSVRYVDDWVILMTGSIKEAKDVRDLVSRKLQSIGF